MKNKDIFIMSQKEVDRTTVVNKIFDREISQQEASVLLGLSGRQMRRIVKRVREQGLAGIIHRLRGQQGNRRINPCVKTKVLKTYVKEYVGFGPRLASEKLLERQKIKIHEETLRLWLIGAGLWSRKRRRELNRRSRRARKENLGEMVQMDGSHHDWLEGRGPRLVLMAYIDDATGRLFARFYEYEGTQPAMDSLKRYAKKYGFPRSIYLDKHATYKNNQKQRYKNWPFRDKEDLTQFARACQQLGVELKYAHSPQAKGRVERVFATLQDRLVKELRLEDVKLLAGANKVLGRYLGVFNQKFMVPAKRRGNFHRSADGMNLREILSVQTEHVLRNDRTTIHCKRMYQVTTPTRARKVTFYEYFNGRIAIRNGQKWLRYKQIDKRPEQERPKRKVKPRKRYRPPKGSYWRDGFKLPGSLKN